MVKSQIPPKQTKGKGNVFVPTEEGSATMKSLDAEGVTVNMNRGLRNTQGFRGHPGGSPVLSLCEEVGVNMDNLIAGIEKNKSDMEMAGSWEFRKLSGLKEHFMTHGLQSIEGQD